MHNSILTNFLNDKSAGEGASSKEVANLPDQFVMPSKEPCLSWGELFPWAERIPPAQLHHRGQKPSESAPAFSERAVLILPVDPSSLFSPRLADPEAR